jgi:hypothetical protein
MAITLGQLLHEFDRSCGEIRPDPILAQQWAQSRYRTVLERIDWPFLVKEGLIGTVASITAGTVAVTLGSTTITETVSNANGWSSSINTRKFRVRPREEYYVLSGYADANPDTAVLDRNYEGATDSDATYDIFQDTYAIPSDARSVISIRRLNSGLELRAVTLGDINLGFPHRADLGEPLYWALLNRSSSDIYQVLLYPAPDTARGFIVTYMEETPSLANGSTSLIEQVPSSLLRDGMMADYWLWRASSLQSLTGWSTEAILGFAGTFEQKFEKQLQEMIVREIRNIPPKRIRVDERFYAKNTMRANRFMSDHSHQFPES